MINRYAWLGTFLLIGCGAAGFEDPLPAPAALEGKSFGASRVDLTWTASGGDGYRIERSVDGTAFETIADVSETRYADVRLAPSTKYRYRVRARQSDRMSEPAVVEVTTGEMGWSKLASSPSQRFASPTAINDSKKSRMLVFGLSGDTPNLLSLDLTSSTWTDISSTLHLGSTPPLTQHAAIYDSDQSRLVLFGGSVGGGALTGNLWALPLPPDPKVPWDRLLAPGWILPGLRGSHTAVYDSTYRRMVVYGGTTSSGETLSGTLMDVWSIDLPPPGVRPTWQLLCTGPPMSGHSAIYDDMNRRMIVFGGGDVWELSLPEYHPYVWKKLEIPGESPASRKGHTAIYDSANRRMVVFGGRDAKGCLLNDVWALSLSGAPAWSQLTPTGSLPDKRTGHTAIYDEANQRMIFYGGRVAPSGPLKFSSETWFLGL